MSLSEFLLNNKQQYLDAVREGKGREWNVVMGNEAGDLDSIASSIAYSWFATTVKRSPSVALIQTPREDIGLRPENVHAFSLASFTLDQRELLCIDDVPPIVPFPSNKFALVDHNRLLPRFSEENEDTKVVAVFDHHHDEGLYMDTADPRMIVVPTGSTTSIIAHHFRLSSPHAELQVPPEIATLLFCGILVDTNGLKHGGKAEALDYEAAAYLLPRSSLASSVGIDAAVAASPELHESLPVQILTRDLLEKKFSVAHLSTTDLLRRDYKQYEWSSSWLPEKRLIRIGLSTVPVGLKHWLSQSFVEFWGSVDQFMDERGLDALGILTTFHAKEKGKSHKKRKIDEEDDGKEKGKKGKHKREMMFVVREVPGGGLEERLWAGLEGSAELELKQPPIGRYISDATVDGSVGIRRTRVYKQGNVRATRKAVAPLLKRIIEDEEDKMETD